MRATVLGLAFAILALFVAVAFAAIDWTYERIAIHDSTHRNMFRAPACAEERCAVQGVTYGLETLVALHRGTATYVFGLSQGLPPSPTVGNFYTDAEVEYLDGLKRLVLAAAIAAAASAGVVAASLALGRSPRTVVAAGVIAAVIGGTVTLAMSIAPLQTLALFDRLAFAPGASSFDARYNLYQLYAPDYGASIGLQIGLSSVVESLAIVVGVATFSRRRR
jgi:hypothetical protein